MRAQGSLCPFGRACGPKGSGGGSGLPQGVNGLFASIFMTFSARDLQNTCVSATLALGGLKMVIFYEVSRLWHWW